MRHITGTIARIPSIQDVRDLLAAKDFDVKQVQDAFDAFAPTWRDREPGALAEWARDWNAFGARYAAAAARARQSFVLLDVPLVSDSLIPDGAAWDGILEALSAKPGFISPGDFQDLHNRLVTAQGKAVDFTGQPQPDPASDVDLKVFQASDASLKAVNIDPSADLVPQIAPYLLGTIGVVAGLLLVVSFRSTRV